MGPLPTVNDLALTPCWMTLGRCGSAQDLEGHTPMLTELMRGRMREARAGGEQSGFRGLLHTKALKGDRDLAKGRLKLND